MDARDLRDDTEESILAAHCRALDAAIAPVMPEDWPGHDRLAADDYPYSDPTSDDPSQDKG